MANETSPSTDAISDPRAGERSRDIEAARRAPQRRFKETAADRARRMLVGLKVGPSRTTVLTAIGGITLFIAVLLAGYLTRK